MSSYTSGPWTAGPPAWFRGQRNPEDGKRPITAGNKGVVANVYGAGNARLIAAAPDMRIALSVAYAALLGFQDYNRPLRERQAEQAEATNMIRELLAKIGREA